MTNDCDHHTGTATTMDTHPTHPATHVVSRDDLPQRLRQLTKSPYYQLMCEAADAIKARDAEIGRLRAAGDALFDAYRAVDCWCSDPKTEVAESCELCNAEEGWQEARRD